jgi:predicted phosphoribosyltransferase
VVDDGAATGLTVQLAANTMKEMGAKKLTIALPVCPIHTCLKLNKITDELEVICSPHNFTGVGSYYEYFPQLSDEEAVRLLIAS